MDGCNVSRQAIYSSRAVYIAIRMIQVRTCGRVSTLPLPTGLHLFVRATLLHWRRCVARPSCRCIDCARVCQSSSTRHLPKSTRQHLKPEFGPNVTRMVSNSIMNPNNSMIVAFQSEYSTLERVCSFVFHNILFLRSGRIVPPRVPIGRL